MYYIPRTKALLNEIENVRCELLLTPCLQLRNIRVLNPRVALFRRKRKSNWVVCIFHM
jgi:hypothetical protein